MTAKLTIEVLDDGRVNITHTDAYGVAVEVAVPAARAPAQAAVYASRAVYELLGDAEAES